MAVQIQVRRDTAANWTSNDPTLASGEWGLETDTRLAKLGDGVTAWTSLAYWPNSIDHGTLSGLGDDDHTQYHNDARGDARYYTETELDAGQLDNRYFTESEHVSTSAGAGNAGDPIVLDAAGHVDATMINESDIDHTNIGSIGTNTHAQIDTHIADGTLHFTEASIDHTAITNVGSNTHAQIDTHIADTANPHGTTLSGLDAEILTGGSKPAHSESIVFYDGDEHALSVYNDESDVTHQVGQEGFIRVYNNSGATVVNGNPVYVSGTEGVEFRPTIALGQSNAKSTSEIIGFSTHDIENNTFGYVTNWGLVNDFDTSSFSPGDPLYLDESTAGDLRTTPPPSGNFEVLLGYVVRSDVTNGRILVSISAQLGSATGDAEELVLEVTKDSSGTINSGEVVRVVGFSVGQSRPTVELADSSSDATMPAIGVARGSFTNSTAGFIVVSGRESGLDTSSFSVGDELYVSETAGELTNVKPTGSALIQKIAQVVRSNPSNGTIEIFGAGRSNDLPNIAQDNLWLGDVSGVPTATSRSGVDDVAIHGNAASEISAVTAKATPTTSDFLLIEDAADTNNKKSITIGDLPAASPATHASTHANGGGDSVDHDTLTNFVADEHVAHSGVTLTAGDGLTGGGDISASRTFDIDIANEVSVPVADDDELLIADVSNTDAIQKTTAREISNLGATSYMDMVSSRYYDYTHGLKNAGSTTTSTASSDDIKATPIFIPNDVTADRITVEVTTAAASSNIRLGIYNDSNGSPGSLLLDAGAVSTATTGSKEITISQSLSKNTWYWLVYNKDTNGSTVALRALSQTGTTSKGGFGHAAGTGTNQVEYIRYNLTYGALPDPFSASFSYSTSAAARITIRIA